MRGKYIVFEGMVGSGKTTQSKLLVERLKKNFPNVEVLWTREPGGSEVADSIRRLVQGTDFLEEMDPICEQYLYAASRAQTLRSVVRPMLSAGGIVVSDRSFFTSLTNQAFGRGMGPEKVLEINSAAVENLLPDRVIFLNIPIGTGLQRTEDHGGDKFEKYGRDFYKKIVTGYDWILKNYDFVKKVDGRGSVEQVSERVWNEVRKVLST